MLATASRSSVDSAARSTWAGSRIHRVAEEIERGVDLDVATAETLDAAVAAAGHAGRRRVARPRPALPSLRRARSAPRRRRCICWRSGAPISRSTDRHASSEANSSASRKVRAAASQCATCRSRSAATRCWSMLDGVTRRLVPESTGDGDRRRAAQALADRRSGAAAQHLADHVETGDAVRRTRTVTPGSGWAAARTNASALARAHVGQRRQDPGAQALAQQRREAGRQPVAPRGRRNPRSPRRPRAGSADGAWPPAEPRPSSWYAVVSACSSGGSPRPLRIASTIACASASDR